MSTAETTAEAAAPATEPSPEQQQLDRVIALNRKVAVARLAYERKHTLAKEAKEAMEAAQDALSEYVDALAEELPLFDGQTPTGVVADPERGEGPWRDVPVAELPGLAASIVDKLTDAGIGTVGALADWTAGGKALNDIPGIGESKALLIEEALDGFWEANKEAVEAIDAAREDEVSEAANGEPADAPEAEPADDLGIYPPGQLGTPSPLLDTAGWAESAKGKPKRGGRKA